jgi:hypothetical protein
MTIRIQPPELTAKELVEFNRLRDLLTSLYAKNEQNLGADDLLPVYRAWQKDYDEITLEDLAAELVHINSHLPSTSLYKGKELVQFLRKSLFDMRYWWSPLTKGSAPEAWGWLAYGLQAVTDDMACYGDSGVNPSPAYLRDALAEAQKESAEEATKKWPDPWNAEYVALANAWLDASPYVLWAMYRDAYKAGLYMMEEQLLSLAMEGETGSMIGTAISESMTDSVGEWVKAQKTAA